MMIFEAFLLFFFGASVLFAFALSIGSFLYKSVDLEIDKFEKLNRFAILIPAYKEDQVIIESVNAIHETIYSKDHYCVFVAADSLKKKTLVGLRDIENTQVIEVAFKTSTKAKAIDRCLSEISEKEYNLVIIADADNILEKEFLTKVNAAFNSGNRVVQTNRIAKNLNTGVAKFDALSEGINNNLYRKGLNGLGFSACLIGSGMMFETTLLKKIIKKALNSVGEDKILQVEVLANGYKIRYLDNVFIYDEKVSDIDNFRNQRKRWLSSQYKYLIENFGEGIKQLFKGKVDYYIMSVLNNLFLPRILTLGVLLFITVIHFFFSPGSDTFLAWVILLFVFVLSLIISTPKMYFKWSILGEAMLYLPKMFLSMFAIMFRLNGADENFINTKHEVKSIDERVNLDKSDNDQDK